MSTGERRRRSRLHQGDELAIELADTRSKHGTFVHEDDFNVTIRLTVGDNTGKEHLVPRAQIVGITIVKEEPRTRRSKGRLLMTDAQILEAIEQVKVTCDLLMERYEPISMRSGLRTCGYDSDAIDQVIRYCYDNGFKNCLDHSVLSHGISPPEYPSAEVCFWGPDQLKSRLNSLNRPLPRRAEYVIVSDYEDDEDGVLYWSNDDGWGGRETATVFTEAQRNDGLPLPLEAAGWVRVSTVIRERT